MFSFLSKNNVNSVKVNDLEGLSGKINLIDVRETYEYNNGHLPNAKNIPMNDILSNPQKYLTKDKEYYIICQSGSRSSKTCKKLSSEGFHVINVSGGTYKYNGQLKS